MSVYKVAMCPECRYNRALPKPPKALPCSHCGAPMTIYPDWWIAWTENGKKQRRRVGPSRTEAVGELEKIRTNQREGRSVLNHVKKISWEDARDLFLAWAEENVSTKGHAMFTSCLRRLEVTFCDRSMDEITRYDVEVEYVRERRQEGVRNKDGEKVRELANGTINRELTTLHRMMVKLVEWKKLEANPLAGMRKLAEAEGRIRYLSDKEIGRLLQECAAEGTGEGRGWAKGSAKGPHLRLAVVIALNTGLRRGDIMALRWQDIDLKAGKISLVTMKSDRRVTIPMTEELQRTLKEYRQEQRVAGIGGHVFPSLRYDPKRAMRPDADIGFAAACQRAGIEDFRFHDLRHTFATHFLRQMARSRGKDMALAMLQEILTHTDIKLTRRYAHVLEEDKAEAMASFSITTPV